MNFWKILLFVVYSYDGVCRLLRATLRNKKTVIIIITMRDADVITCIKYLTTNNGSNFPSNGPRFTKEN
jgi:hypothetical protein